MKKYLKIFIIFGILLIVAGVSIYFYINRYPLRNASGNTKSLTKEEILSYDKFYEGISINNIDLKDLTKEEAINKIKENLQVEDKFTFKYNDYVKNFIPKDIEFSYDYENLVNEAFKLGRSGNAKERMETLKNLLANPKNFEVKSSYNLEKLNEIIKEVSEKLNSEPVDEKIDFSKEKASVIDGKLGIKVETEKITNNFKAIPVKFNLEIPVSVTEYKKLDRNLVSSIKGVIGEATTKFDYQPNRNTNIKIAANKMNEFVVNPGETFSFANVLGEVSSSTGYKPAGTFVNDKVVDSIGGGICQVSSTLYQALVKSDLKIVERNQHSMRVDYCTIGLDAMYYAGSSDLKFKNNFDFPIIIKSYVSNGSLTFKVFGDTDKKNYEISLFTSGVSTIPMPIEEIEDPELPEGEKVIVEKGFNGYRGSSYIKRGNGEAVLLNSDYYKPKKQVVKVGTKKEPTEEKEKEND